MYPKDWGGNAVIDLNVGERAKWRNTLVLFRPTGFMRTDKWSVKRLDFLEPSRQAPALINLMIFFIGIGDPDGIEEPMMSALLKRLNPSAVQAMVMKESAPSGQKNPYRIRFFCFLKNIDCIFIER